MRLSLTRKVGAAFALAVLLLMFISAVSYRSVADSLDTTDRVRITWIILASDLVAAGLLMFAGFVIHADLVRDVAERKEVEERLRHNEEKYRLLFEQNPLPLWLFDPSSLAILAVNEAAVRHYGYPREEFLAMTIRDIRPAEDIPRLQAAVAQLAEARPSDPQPMGIWRHRKKDGTIILVEITTDFFLLHGKPIRFSLAHDVTERIRVEEALRQERDFAEGLIELAPAIVVVLDPEGRIVRINAYLEELAGYRREEVQGQNWFTTFVPERDRSHLADLYRRALSDEPIQDFSARLVTKDGRERNIQWFAKNLRDKQGTVRAMLGLGHDTTELKQAQKRAVQAEQLAAIGQMVTGLAHESRNALQRSQACLKMLSWEVPDRPKALELLDRLQKALNHLLQLYEEVQAYAAPIKISPQRCHLGGLMQETWDRLKSLRGGRHAHLHLIPTTVDLHCEVDRLTLEKLFGHILRNAVAACSDPVAIEVQWSEVILDKSASLQIAVRDNGPGLTPQQRAKIFEPFYTTKTHGTGLGMAIAKRIVEAHQGRIAVGPDTRAGAEILVTLPREQP